ncbi:MAG: uracil-DNA glycosylase [Candidatus Thermoplasmatota archaeon]|nr:uracil-DNA glycosylase [Candidatus Thermoplasmatota archaeon]
MDSSEGEELENIGSLRSEITACCLCPRLCQFRKSVALRYERPGSKPFWAKPVPGYGDINGELLIVGLAPAARGGNRTGRVFTGDRSAEFLVRCLHEKGFTNMPASTDIDDGLQYRNTYVTAAVKCVPPGDRPERNEIENCSRYLIREIKMMPNIRAILTLGIMAHDATVNALRISGYIREKVKFSHGHEHQSGSIRIFSSYHPSPRNVNTGRLNEEKFLQILDRICSYLGT